MESDLILKQAHKFLNLKKCVKTENCRILKGEEPISNPHLRNLQFVKKSKLGLQRGSLQKEEPHKIGSMS